MGVDEKWAKKLSAVCGVSDRFLQMALEELTESCGADAPTSKKIIEELTLSCHLDQKELMEFVKQVSKNCPVDIQKLYDEIVNAEGDKAKALDAIEEPESSTRGVSERDGAR
jgi:Cft2 family RNA processing exonuclease